MRGRHPSTQPLLHALNKLRSRHIERVGDIDQAFKGDSATTTFDRLQDARRKTHPPTQVIEAKSALFTKARYTGANVAAPLHREVRAIGSRRGVRIAAIDFVRTPIVALLVGHLTVATNPFRGRCQGEVVSDPCHI